MSLVLLGLSELSGFLLVLFANFGQGINNVENDETIGIIFIFSKLVLKNSTLLIILLILLGIPTVFFTFSVMILFGFHVYLLSNFNYKNLSKGKNYKREIRKRKKSKKLINLKFRLNT